MNGRERSRLRRAREDGFLDARCRDNRALVHAYGLWCWRLRLPMVWLERGAPCSRDGRVQVEMFTTANHLATGGHGRINVNCAPGNAAKVTRGSAHRSRCAPVALPDAR